MQRRREDLCGSSAVSFRYLISSFALTLNTVFILSSTSRELGFTVGAEETQVLNGIVLSVSVDMIKNQRERLAVPL
jgi:hypothetical protein